MTKTLLIGGAAIAGAAIHKLIEDENYAVQVLQKIEAPDDYDLGKEPFFEKTKRANYRNQYEQKFGARK